MGRSDVEHEVAYLGWKVILDCLLVLLLIATLEFSVVEVEDFCDCRLVDYPLGSSSRRDSYSGWVGTMFPISMGRASSWITCAVSS